MEPNIELHLLNYRLKILSIKKESIHKLMHPLVKIGFTNKTKCTFFSFTETNDDYSIVVDNTGFEELSSFINESDQYTVCQSDWIPMYLCGEDLPDSMSISKIAKYLIQPLADFKISILAISMYQCDYVLVQHKDYEKVINCLSVHIPKIFDESLSPENEIVFMKSKGKLIFNLPKNTLSTNGHSDEKCDDLTNGESLRKVSTSHSDKHKSVITLPLIIPDNSEYCITGLYNLDAFFLIIPSLIEIMFFETEDYKHNEIFFNFTKKETDISIVMETRLLKKFSPGALLNIVNDYWKLIRIGQAPVGLEVFGVCSSISHPLELANIDEYYISSFHTGYCFIPSDKLELAKDLFAKGKAKFVSSSRFSIGEVLDEEQQQHQNGNSNINHQHLSDDNDSHSDSEININNNSNDYEESSIEPLSSIDKHNNKHNDFKTGCLEDDLFNEHDNNSNGRQCNGHIDHSLGEIMQKISNSSI